VPGNFELAQLGDLFADSVPLPQADEYESTTVGGLITEEVGHIPFPGEVIHLAGLRAEVLASSPHHVERVRIQPIADDARQAEIGT